MRFAIFVVGISQAVRIWELERYIDPYRQPRMPGEMKGEAKVLALTGDRWVLEVYRTVIETLQGIAWVLLLFFLFSLMAYVVVRVFESRKGTGE